MRWVLGGLANHPPEDLAKKFDYKPERREVEKFRNHALHLKGMLHTTECLNMAISKNNFQAKVSLFFFPFLNNLCTIYPYGKFGIVGGK